MTITNLTTLPKMVLLFFISDPGTNDILFMILVGLLITVSIMILLLGGYMWKRYQLAKRARVSFEMSDLGNQHPLPVDQNSSRTQPEQIQPQHPPQSTTGPDKMKRQTKAENEDVGYGEFVDETG